MTLTPLINAAMPIPYHAIAAMFAVIIGVAQLWLNKVTLRHRILGYVGAGLLVFVAFTRFFILNTCINAPFNCISKTLSVLVLVMLYWASGWLALAKSINIVRR